MTFSAGLSILWGNQKEKNMSYISKYKTPKALKSKKSLKKGLKAYGKSLGLDSEFFVSFTFDDTTGEFKICPCCGGDSLEKEILGLI